jgi:hypothetical protein
MADPRVLFGGRVDRYIPPEVRQGIGALLAGADMLNPVSAYREYLKDVREGDVVGGATNMAGFVAPGIAGALGSRLARPALRSVEPYSDDAARALMEMLSPTGAPEGMSRREFLAGAGAAAAAPMLPAEELLEAAGRAATRGGGRAIDELMGLMTRRNALYDARDAEVADFMRSHGEYEDLLDDYLDEKFGSSIEEAERAFLSKLYTSEVSREELETLPDRTLRRLLAEISFDDYLGPDDLSTPELMLGERIRGILRARNPSMYEGRSGLIE